MFQRLVPFCCWIILHCVDTRFYPSIGWWIFRLFPLFFNGLPGWLSDKSACRCTRYKFNPWVGKIPLEKGMAAHSSILAWRIPWTEAPCRLQSMGSQSVRHKWATFTSLTGSSMTRTYWVPTTSKYGRCLGFVTADQAALRLLVLNTKILFKRKRKERERRKPGFLQTVSPDAPFTPWPLCSSSPSCSDLPQPCLSAWQHLLLYLTLYLGVFPTGTVSE